MNRLNRMTPVATAVAALMGTFVLGVPAMAQEQRVEITGSAIKRVDAEGALPIIVITREEIARSGAINTEELVNSIAAVASIGGINNATGAGSSTAGRSTISLRGLSGGRTLVLVNGRRLAVSVGDLAAAGRGRRVARPGGCLSPAAGCYSHGAARAWRAFAFGA